MLVIVKGTGIGSAGARGRRHSRQQEHSLRKRAGGTRLTLPFRPWSYWRTGIQTIPQTAALTILRALTPLGDDPRRQDADIKKLAGYTDRYRLRVGDYRVIYEIVDEQLIILIVGVGHRREA